MWRQIYAVIVWAVGADEPLEWHPMTTPVDQPEPRARTIDDIKSELRVEQVGWEYDRRHYGADSREAGNDKARIDLLLGELGRAMALLGVWDVESSAQLG